VFGASPSALATAAKHSRTAQIILVSILEIVEFRCRIVGARVADEPPDWNP
jgi:hypothetical protein